MPSHTLSLSRRARAVTAVVAALLLAACGSGTEPEPSAAASSGDGFPVSVTSCGRSTRYTEAPSRAVANDINMTEMLLALGLADRMAGIAGVDGRDDVLPDLRDDFDEVEQLSDNYIQIEPLLGANPDFLFAGWNYGLSEADGLTPAVLHDKGIATYELTESCAHVTRSKRQTSIEETFTDLRNLGRIFGVTDRADALIAEQQAILDDIRERLTGTEPVEVFVYDSGEDAPFTAPGLAIPTDLIERAGGHNIFADLAETWTSVSWEQVLTRDPDCIVIVDYGDVTWQHKRDFMKNDPRLNTITGVQRNCFVPLPYAAMTPGIRNADAVQTIAQALHPDQLA